MYNHMILFRAEMHHTDKHQIRTVNRVADKKTKPAKKTTKKTTQRLSGFFSHSTMAAMVLIPVLTSMNGMF